eukprot:7390266-Prymnesium_polylepis.1
MYTRNQVLRSAPCTVPLRSAQGAILTRENQFLVGYLGAGKRLPARRAAAAFLVVQYAHTKRADSGLQFNRRSSIDDGRSIVE